MTKQAENNIAEKSNTVFTEDQKSAIGKAIFINWLLNYAKKYPDNFPEKDGLVIHDTIGNPAEKAAFLSREEILLWYNTNRPNSLMTSEELDEIIIIQTRNGLVNIGHRYYTLLV